MKSGFLKGLYMRSTERVFGRRQPSSPDNTNRGTIMSTGAKQWAKTSLSNAATPHTVAAELKAVSRPNAVHLRNETERTGTIIIT